MGQDLFARVIDFQTGEEQICTDWQNSWLRIQTDPLRKEQKETLRFS